MVETALVEVVLQGLHDGSRAVRALQEAAARHCGRSDWLFRCLAVMTIRPPHDVCNARLRELQLISTELSRQPRQSDFPGSHSASFAKDNLAMMQLAIMMMMALMMMDHDDDDRLCK